MVSCTKLTDNANFYALDPENKIVLHREMWIAWIFLKSTILGWYFFIAQEHKGAIEQKKENKI